MKPDGENELPPRAPQNTARVRFSEPAMPADRLLEALGKQTRTVLVCAPDVRGEILLLHVRDLPLQDVMARIAEAAGARWRQSGDTWRLERPDEMARAQQERDITARAAIIARGLQHILSPLRKPWNEAVLRATVTQRQKHERTGQSDPEVDHLDPVYRAFLRCLSDVTSDTIARIPVGGRIVFATEPTPMQKPLGEGARIALAKVAEEQLLFATTLRKADFEGDDSWSRPYQSQTTPVRALLIIECNQKMTFGAQLMLLDRERRAVVRFYVPDGSLSFDAPWKEETRSRNSAVVPLSARSRILLSLDRGNVTKPRLSPEALRLLTMPERYEPLSMVVSDGYLALARTKNRNMIAALPDYLLDGSPVYRENLLITLDQVEQWPASRPPMRIADRNGWLIVTPLYPYEARLNRVDRTIFGRIVRRVAQRGWSRIEDTAEFAVISGDESKYHFGNKYLWLVCKGIFNDGQDDWTLLSLYGALTPEQRKALLAGKPIPYGSLTGRQRRFAEKAVFGAHDNLSYSKREPVPERYTYLSDEPTECYPNGLPAEGMIRGSRKRESIVYFWEPGKKEGDPMYWQMDECSSRFHSGSPPPAPTGGFTSLRYDVRYEESITVEVDVTPWVRMGAEYRQTDLPPTGPPVPLSNLAPDVQKRVNKELERIRKLRGESPR